MLGTTIGIINDERNIIFFDERLESSSLMNNNHNLHSTINIDWNQHLQLTISMIGTTILHHHAAKNKETTTGIIFNQYWWINEDLLQQSKIVTTPWTNKYQNQPRRTENYFITSAKLHQFDHSEDKHSEQRTSLG